ncbi:MAG TPA: xylulokinase [Dongiaceae bacterium]|nr:xylulokinase [Dongiaceae bacterium]
MAGPTYLGLDLGTSALKALLVDDMQRVLATSSVTIATSRPQPLWSEQAPDDWWRAAEQAVAALRRQDDDAFRRLAAIGLSGQMHGAVAIGRDGRPLRPAILWNDGRATQECDELHAAVPDLAALAGAQAVPGYTAPKMLWLRKHEPAVFSGLHKLLLPKDYLRLKLTGDYATDCCDAAGALLLDEAGRCWSPVLAAASGLRLDQLPHLAEGSEATGVLRAEIADAWGLGGKRIVVAAGAGDAAAGAIGIGAVGGAAEDAYIALGTAAQVFAAMPAYRAAPTTLLQCYAHALPSRWFQAGAVLNGASCVGWAARLLGCDDIAALLQRTEKAYRGPGDLLFLPYLVGERLPHNDPQARGVLFGLDPETSQTAVMQAVLEGVAFTLHEAHRILAEAGTAITQAAVVGGGAQSRFWTRLIADILGLDLIRFVDGETGPAFGAARLARLAVTGEAVADVCRKPEVLDITRPDPQRHAQYRSSLERFTALYQALKPEFRRAALMPD